VLRTSRLMPFASFDQLAASIGQPPPRVGERVHSVLPASNRPAHPTSSASTMLFFTYSIGRLPDLFAIVGSAPAASRI